jgi:hypothetical protein
VTSLAQHQYVTICRTIFQFHRLDSVPQEMAPHASLHCCSSIIKQSAGGRRSCYSFLDSMQIVPTHTITRHSLYSCPTLLNSLEKSLALRADNRSACQEILHEIGDSLPCSEKPVTTCSAA